MEFYAEMTKQKIKVRMEGPDDRWFAFGFRPSESGDMLDTDPIVYSTGTSLDSFTPAQWQDYYVNSRSEGGVLRDSDQNWMVTSSMEAGGSISSELERYLDTGDSNDEFFFLPFFVRSTCQF